MAAMWVALDILARWRYFTLMHAMPLLIVTLCLLAIAYRYYSAFLAARIATLDDLRQTPAYLHNDGHNFHPTHKWVLFGHHFAAISGAGPLIGPVLAAQFGYLPGLLWIVIGVCLGGAVQDFLVLAASLRKDGRSLAEIAQEEIGKIAGGAVAIGILFIVIVALAGLGKVVVKALGGEEVKYPADSVLVLPKDSTPPSFVDGITTIPPQTTLHWNNEKDSMVFSESFPLRCPESPKWADGKASIPKGAARLVPGSYWGTFTIGCTVPIALFVGLYMYKIRPGRVVEASLIGAALTLGATFAGGLIPANGPLAHALNLSATQVTVSIAVYGFIASVLPVWVLLCPRDYLSSFLKIGTIGALVIGAIIANPKLQAPALNTMFFEKGPVITGKIFPFLFITIMCGAISGFHSLVSSGTTPKMIKKESDARVIGYGAMLIEGLVGVVAMVAAAALPVNAYYDMNTELAKMPQWKDKILQVGGLHELEQPNPVGEYERLTGESLRGRTGGAVTLAVGFAHIFDQSMGNVFTEHRRELMWKYWYHFAIMFEALFILTTIDTGTRIGRFLLQEMLAKIHPSLGLKGKGPGGIIATAIIVFCWAYFMNIDSFNTIWAIFGIANQTLAVIALAVVAAWMAGSGKSRYLWVVILPMLFVMSTTSLATVQTLFTQFNTLKTQYAASAPDKTLVFRTWVQAGLLTAMMTCMVISLVASFRKVIRA